MEAAERASLSPVEVVCGLLEASTARIAITGATGWFGRTTLELLYQALGDSASSRVEAYASSARTLRLTSGRTVEVRPLESMPQGSEPLDTVFHFAFLTREKVQSMGLANYLAGNLGITSTVLRALDARRPKQLIVTSSGAVYDPHGGLANDFQGNPYGTLKVQDEAVFRSASADLGINCVIPRVFSVAGPYMTHAAHYALGDMIAAATAGSPIIVKATRPVLRSYCGVDEIIAVSFWAAHHHQELVFDTAGHEVEMAQLASAVSQTFGSTSPVQRSVFDPDANADRYVGNGTQMIEMADTSGLGLRGLAELIGDSTDRNSEFAVTRPANKAASKET
jgi:nucleoside-diphosphate-sugar epimerase